MKTLSCAGARAAALSLVLLSEPAAFAHGVQATAAEVPESGRIVVVGEEFGFTPDAIRVEKDQEVTIVFRNEGRVSHNLTIPDLGLHTDTIQGGAEATLTFVAEQAGVHAFWCTVPGHKEAGMTGEITVAR